MQFIVAAILSCFADFLWASTIRQSNLGIAPSEVALVAGTYIGVLSAPFNCLSYLVAARWVLPQSTLLGASMKCDLILPLPDLHEFLSKRRRASR